MGIRHIQIFIAFFAPRKKEWPLENVPGKRNDDPRIKPAQLAVTTALISNVPCIHITKTDCQPRPCSKKMY